MIRTLNFAFIAITSLACLGVYRTAEQARTEQGALKAAQAAIIREDNMLTVLGAEWARITQPARIQALTQRHLDLSDSPAAELSSLSQLPSKDAPLVPEAEIRNARAVLPQSAPLPAAAPESEPRIAPPPSSDATLASYHTGT